MPETPSDAATPSSSGPDDKGIALCASSWLKERGLAHVWDVMWRNEPVRAFVVRVDGQVVAYLNRCTHVAAELDWQPGQFFDHDQKHFICALHGAHYEPTTGRCAGGPCGRQSLTPVTVRERDGVVAWYPSDDVRALQFGAQDDTDTEFDTGSDAPSRG